ncbi:hypothetical protein AURANDRAFT_68312 [Aureococcus anophagefferens]|uniref:Uncharacterized protein n=1 Tax=Aureococcus anophagefferens TaxID=44056 RepID=F0YP76_AURAN|nr:hypothetical protein AURANDRAFT_68312 [Aureococcus anophagefferens]EGB03079.1 hypothetical protein AURANDRAFT_68312 [Aureococcus anophagefferens]|eukprot:XP_009042216.1 hypothetical protein AURANDRAFT_68312 [Aureococcus anophagefferens]
MEQPSPGPSPSRPSVSVTDRVSSARESLGGLSLFDDEDLADLAGSDDGLLDFPELPVEETVDVFGPGAWPDVSQAPLGLGGRRWTLAESLNVGDFVALETGDYWRPQREGGGSTHAFLLARVMEQRGSGGKGYVVADDRATRTHDNEEYRPGDPVVLVRLFDRTGADTRRFTVRIYRANGRSVLRKLDSGDGREDQPVVGGTTAVAPRATAGNAWAGAYEEKLFKAEATAIIGDFAAAAADGDDARLFLYYASHLSHTPMQVEQHVLDAFLNESATLSLPGLGYAAMTNALDAAVANVTAGYCGAGRLFDLLLDPTEHHTAKYTVLCHSYFPLRYWLLLICSRFLVACIS